MAKKLGIGNYLNIPQHTTNWVFGNFQFLLFLCFLAIVYIANAHFAERNVRDIQRLQKEGGPSRARPFSWPFAMCCVFHAAV